MATKFNNAINSPSLGGFSTATVSGVILSNADSTVTASATFTGAGADGKLLIGSAVGAPAVANLTAGAGIAITNGNGSISISATGADTYSVVAGDTTIAAGGAYLVNASGPIVFTLPSSAFTQGQSFSILSTAVNTGGWSIKVATGNAGQQVQVGNVVSLNTLDNATALSSTSNVGGDGATFVCSVDAAVGAGTWVAANTIGSLSVVYA